MKSIKKIFVKMLLFIVIIFSAVAVGFSSWTISSKDSFSNVQISEYVCINTTKGLSYYRIEDALDHASSGDKIYVYPNQKVTIYRDCTIGSNVSLYLPYASSGEGTSITFTYDGRKSGESFETGNSISNFSDSSATNVSKYLKCEVVLNDNVTLKMNGGSLFIGGVTGHESQGLSGHTSGNYAQLTMNKNSKIVANNSTIECLGYIKEGNYLNNGSTIQLNKSTLKEPFVVYDYKGGTSTAGAYQGSNGTVSPFSIFDMPNTQVEINISYDSNLIGYADLYTGETTIIITINDKHNTTDINIFGSSNSIFNMNTGGSIILKYTPNTFGYTKDDDSDTTSHTKITFNGGGRTSSMSLLVNVPILGNINVSTEDALFPISYKLDLTFASGSFQILNKMKIMTGSKVYILPEATIDSSSQTIIYSSFDDKTSINPYPDINEEGILSNNGTLNVKSSGGFAGYLSTDNAYTNNALTVIESDNLSLTSSEGYGTRDGLSFNYVETSQVNETAKAKIYSGNDSSIQNLEKTIYVKNNDGWIKSDNLGSYYIVFHSGQGIFEDGSNVLTQEYSIIKDSTITLNSVSPSVNPTLDYYEIEGWYLDENFVNKVGNLTVYDGLTIDVYAKWQIKIISISYDISYKDCESEDEFIYPNNPISLSLNDFPTDDTTIQLELPTDGDLEFYGWYLNDDESVQVNSITKEMIKDDIVFSGFFSADSIYQVNFVDNMNFITSLNTQNVSNSGEIVLPSSLAIDKDPTIEYYLDGWYLDQQFITKFDSSSYILESDIVLYAKWNLKIEIKYSHKDEITYYMPGDSITLIDYDGDCVKEQTNGDDYITKYEYDGWSINNEFIGFNSKYIVSSDAAIDNRITIYPHYNETKFCMVYLKIDSVPKLSSDNTITVNYNNIVYEVYGAFIGSNANESFEVPFGTTLEIVYETYNTKYLGTDKLKYGQCNYSGSSFSGNTTTTNPGSGKLSITINHHYLFEIVD